MESKNWESGRLKQFTVRSTEQPRPKDIGLVAQVRVGNSQVSEWD